MQLLAILVVEIIDNHLQKTGSEQENVTLNDKATALTL
jgi:hypothetical protein